MPADVPQPTSLSLLHRASRNDEKAWEQLVHLYGPLVQKWCRRSGLPEEDTADVFQETFRTVSTNLENYAPRRSVGSFRSWLRTIVRTRIVDHQRSRNRQVPGQGGTDAQRRMANLADPLADENDEDEAADRVVVVHQALELIKPEFSEQNWKAFQSVALDGRSAVDVARELNVNPQTVRQANYRIRRRLRLILQDLTE